MDLRVHIKTTSSFKGWKLPDQVEKIISLSDAMDSDTYKKIYIYLTINILKLVKSQIHWKISNNFFNS